MCLLRSRSQNRFCFPRGRKQFPLGFLLLPCVFGNTDRKSTRLNSSHANIYTLSLHDALPILNVPFALEITKSILLSARSETIPFRISFASVRFRKYRSEEHTSELQSRQYLHSFPTRRSSDLKCAFCARDHKIDFAFREVGNNSL